MERLGFSFELKSSGDADGVGRFRGLGSVYGNVDLHGDVVMKGAFTKSLAAKGGEVPLLWQHDTREPIGLAKLTDTEKGLQVDGELDLDVAEGRRAYSAIKRRYVKGLSIGYDALKDEFKNGKRELHELDLWELSVVTFGANPLATIAQAKDLEVARAMRAALSERTELIRSIGHGVKTNDSNEMARLLARNFSDKMRVLRVACQR